MRLSSLWLLLCLCSVFALPFFSVSVWHGLRAAKLWSGFDTEILGACLTDGLAISACFCVPLLNQVWHVGSFGRFVLVELDESCLFVSWSFCDFSSSNDRVSDFYT